MTTSDDSFIVEQFLTHRLVDGRVTIEIGVFQGKIVSAQVYPRNLDDLDAKVYLQTVQMALAVSQLVGSTPAAAIAAVQPNANGAIWVAWQAAISTSRQAVIDTDSLHKVDDAFESALVAGGWAKK